MRIPKQINNITRLTVLSKKFTGHSVSRNETIRRIKLSPAHRAGTPLRVRGHRDEGDGSGGRERDREQGRPPTKHGRPSSSSQALQLAAIPAIELEEQADLQHAIELQNRRIMDLQLLDVKRSHHHHRALSTGAVIPSPTSYSPSYLNNSLFFASDTRSSSSPDSGRRTPNSQTAHCPTPVEMQNDYQSPSEHVEIRETRTVSNQMEETECPQKYEFLPAVEWMLLEFGADRIEANPELVVVSTSPNIFISIINVFKQFYLLYDLLKKKQTNESFCRVFGDETIKRKYVANTTLCGYLNK
ncbi:hypothetical protein LXL04_033867 [Taraxacum kok-saghyz]